MSWIKLDDQWMDHPKIIAAGRDARDVWLASITWCAKHLTNGYFPANLLPSLAVSAGVDVANCQTFARTLLDVRLWEATETGYMVHDYLDYNPTKEQALATREARKEAGRRGGKQKASNLLSKTLANQQQNSTPSPSPYPIEEEYKSTLSDEFTRLTNIPAHNLQEWTEADQVLTRAGVTPEELKVAVDKLNSDGMTYSGLYSMTKTALWVHAQRAAGRPIFTDTNPGKNGNQNGKAKRTRTLTGADGTVIVEEIP